MRILTRLALPATLLALAVLGAACGGGDADPTTAATTPAPPTTATSAETTTQEPATTPASGIDEAALEAIIVPARDFIAVDDECRQGDSAKQLACERDNRARSDAAFAQVQVAAAEVLPVAQSLPGGEECAGYLETFAGDFAEHFILEERFLEQNIKANETESFADNASALGTFYQELNQNQAADAPTVVARALATCRAAGDPEAPSSVLGLQLANFFGWTAAVNSGLGINTWLVGFCVANQEQELTDCVNQYLDPAPLRPIVTGQNDAYVALSGNPDYADLPQSCRALVEQDHESAEKGLAAIEKIEQNAAPSDDPDVVVLLLPELTLQTWQPASDATVFYWTQRTGILDCMEAAAAVT